MSDDDLFRAAQRGDRDAFRQILGQILQNYPSASRSAIESAMQVAVWNDHGEIAHALHAGHAKQQFLLSREFMSGDGLFARGAL